MNDKTEYVMHDINVHYLHTGRIVFPYSFYEDLNKEEQLYVIEQIKILFV